MPNYPYSFQLPPLNVQDIPNDGVAGEFLGINGSGVLDWLPVASGGGDMLKSENLSGLANYTTARTNIGLGTTDSPTFANLTLTSPSLSSSAPVTISQTWGTTGIYTAFKVVANETAVANTLSNVLELWSGNAATLKLSIRKSGQIVGPSGTIAAPTYGFADTDWGTGFSGWYRLGTGVACSTAGGTISAFSITHTNIRIGSSIPFGWTSGTAENALDTILLRDGAANTLALRNGTAAQTFNVYGTWTTAITNFERLAIKYNTTDVAYQIAAEKGTTNGDYRPLQLWTGGASRLHVTTAGNVGIGTTAPSANLELYGNSGQTVLKITSIAPGTGSNLIFNGAFGQLNNNVGSFFITNESATDPVIFRAGGQVERMRITSAGNVGIGTTAPGSTLTVAGTFYFGSNNGALPGYASYGGNIGASRYFFITGTSVDNTTIYLQNNSSGSKNAMVRLLGSGSGADYGALQMLTIESSPIIFATNVTEEKMRITAAGNVGIGTTSPTSKLQVTNGDVEIETVTSGIIMKAAGTANRFRITLNAGGTDFVITAL